MPGPAVLKMAYAACQAVVEQPLEATTAPYFCLFLRHGENCIYWHYRSCHAFENPNARVVYMSTEEWVNEYIMAIHGVLISMRLGRTART